MVERAPPSAVLVSCRVVLFPVDFRVARRDFFGREVLLSVIDAKIIILIIQNLLIVPEKIEMLKTTLRTQYLKKNLKVEEILGSEKLLGRKNYWVEKF